MFGEHSSIRRKPNSPIEDLKNEISGSHVDFRLTILKPKDENLEQHFPASYSLSKGISQKSSRVAHLMPAVDPCQPPCLHHISHPPTDSILLPHCTELICHIV